MKQPKSVKKIIIDIIIILLVAVVLISGFFVGKFYLQQRQVTEEVDEIHEIVSEKVAESEIIKENPEARFSKEAFNSLKEINSDLVAYIDWDTGILSLPVVQAKNNDYYLRRNFNKEYSVLGVPFMDYKSKTDNQNMVIYGHNSVYDADVMFSPLRSLLDQETFDNNNTFTIYYENEVRRYQIVAMYYFHTVYDNTVNHNFTVPTWSNKEFNRYFSWVESKNMIKANIDYSNSDYFVTLQTCRSYKTDERLIVVAKEISAKLY